MNCLSDSLCGATPVLDWILTATAAVDYYGTMLFGGQWQALGPDVAARADALSALLADLFDQGTGGCRRFASLGVFHG